MGDLTAFLTDGLAPISPSADGPLTVSYFANFPRCMACHGTGVIDGTASVSGLPRNYQWAIMQATGTENAYDAQEVINAATSLSVRVNGALRMGSGIITAGAGLGLSTTGLGAVAGLPLIAWSMDQEEAGRRALVSGQAQTSFGGQGIQAVAGTGTGGRLLTGAYDTVPAIALAAYALRPPSAARGAGVVPKSASERMGSLSDNGYGQPYGTPAPRAGKPAFIGNASKPGQAFKNLVSDITTNMKGASQAEKIQAFRDGVAAIRQHVGDFTVDAEFLALDLGGGALDYTVFVGGPGPKGTPILAFGKNGKVYTGSLEASIGRTPSGQPVFNPFRANLVGE